MKVALTKRQAELVYQSICFTRDYKGNLSPNDFKDLAELRDFFMVKLNL